jgi:hypothetical protein
VSLEWKGRRGSAGRHGDLHGGDAGLNREGAQEEEEGGGADRWGRSVSDT